MSTESNAHIEGEMHAASDDLHAAVHRNIQASKSHAMQAAGELKTAVEAKSRELLHAADDKASEIRARAEGALDEAKAKARVLQKDTEEYVRKNPLTSVCIALGAGFVLGILARR